MVVRPEVLRLLPAGLLACSFALASACQLEIGPVPVPTPKPGASGGSPQPSVGPGTRTPFPSPPPASATPAATAIPSPGATGAPSASPDPNATPTARPSGTPTAGPGASPRPSGTPGPTRTPVPWPSAVAIPGGTPTQSSVFEIKSSTGGKPTDVAVDPEGVAWITVGEMSGSGTSLKGEIVRMKADGTPLQVLSLDGNPRRIEPAAGGGFWVGMDAKDPMRGAVGATVMRLGTDAKVLSRLDLGSGEIQALVPDRDGNVWVAQSGGRISRIAPAGGLLGTYNHPAGSSMGGYSPGVLGVDGEGYGWLTDYSGRRVTRIKPSMVKDRDVPFGTDAQPYGVAASGDRVWVVMSNAIRVMRLDGSDHFDVVVGTPHPFMKEAGGGAMWALSATPGGGGSVVRYESDGRASEAFAVGNDVLGFAVGADGSIWGANYMAATVTRVAAR